MRDTILRGLLRAAFSTLTAVALVAPSFAQVTTATLYGRVQDPSGALIPGARVTLINNNTGFTKEAVSNERGEVTIPFVTVGSYTALVSSEGFKGYEQTGLQLSSGQKVAVTFTLELGVTTETVNVSAEAPLLNTVSAEQDVNLNSDQVHEAPAFAPRYHGNPAERHGLVRRGRNDGIDQRPSAARLLILGGRRGRRSRFRIPVDLALSEFQFHQGRQPGSRAGSRDLEEHLLSRNRADRLRQLQHHHQRRNERSARQPVRAVSIGRLNANNHILARKTSRVYHQYGGSLGGPVVKNKVFLFGAFEGYRLNEQRPLTGFVPSVKFRDEIGQAIPESRAYWDAWYLPTEAPANPDDARAFFSGSGAKQNQDNHWLSAATTR